VFRHSLARLGRSGCLLVAASAFLCSARDLQAQDVTRDLFAGDSVRVDGVLIGRVIRVEGPIATVTSREKPRCRAGEGHGDAPICDPAPMIRRDIDLRQSTVERRLQKRDPNTWTAIGAVVGGAAFAGLGYAIGPSIGFGKVAGCSEISVTSGCSAEDYVPPDELEQQQKKSDQRRGAAFFGVIGGSAAAIFARKMSTGWVRFEPSFPTTSEEGWGLTVVLPGVR
jgi:hypothetical protein